MVYPITQFTVYCSLFTVHNQKRTIFCAIDSPNSIMVYNSHHRIYDSCALNRIQIKIICSFPFGLAPTRRFIQTIEKRMKNARYTAA